MECVACGGAAISEQPERWPHDRDVVRHGELGGKVPAGLVEQGATSAEVAAKCTVIIAVSR